MTTPNTSRTPMRLALGAALAILALTGTTAAHAQSAVVQKIDWAADAAIRDFRGLDERNAERNEATALNATDNVALLLRALTNAPIPAATVLAAR